MVGWHHRLNGHAFEQAPGDGEGQGSLLCCSHGVTKSQTRLSDSNSGETDNKLTKFLDKSNINKAAIDHKPAPQSKGLSRKEHWSVEPFPSPGASSRPRDQTWVYRIYCLSYQGSPINQQKINNNTFKTHQLYIVKLWSNNMK